MKMILTCLEETTSTNAVLKEMALSGARVGTAVTAVRQNAGRGRLGKSFLSPEGGLYLSVLAAPPAEGVSLSLFTPLAAVAVKKAIRDCTGAETEIKWVNDLLLNKKKLCGILSELVICPDGTRRIVLGIGVNVACQPFPDSFPVPAVSLEEAGYPTAREDLQNAILRCLCELTEGIGPEAAQHGMKEYRDACMTIGRRVEVRMPERTETGVACDLGPEGELILRLDDGKRLTVRSGEVSVLPLLSSRPSVP